MQSGLLLGSKYRDSSYLVISLPSGKGAPSAVARGTQTNKTALPRKRLVQQATQALN